MIRSRFNPARSARTAALTFALSMIASPVLAQDFAALDTDFKGQVRPRSQNIYAGDEVELAGSGFKPGQKVTLQRGTKAINSTPLVADEKGEFTTKLKVPADATIGTHPIVVIAEGPDSAAVVEIKISKQLEHHGADKFEITSKKVIPGLYQVAYSSANSALFVTSAVGRQANPSHIVKLNPETLEIVAQASAPETTDGGRAPLHAVYGVGVDDANGNVWATNTRTGAISVFKQSDLSLVKQYDNNVAPHGRDVVVSQKSGQAYASANNSTLSVFDAKTLEQLPSIEITSSVRGEKFFPTSLQLDDATGKLYTVSLNTAELAIINTADNTVEKIIRLPNSKSTIGVGIDTAHNRALVVSQGTDNLLIVDLESGKVLHDVYVGTGALNVEFEPVSKLAFISVRGGGTIVAVDSEGQIQAVLDGGSNPNHLVADDKGNIFAVNKSRGEDDATGDRITKISPKK